MLFKPPLYCINQCYFHILNRQQKITVIKFDLRATTVTKLQIISSELQFHWSETGALLWLPLKAEAQRNNEWMLGPLTLQLC